MDQKQVGSPEAAEGSRVVILGTTTSIGPVGRAGLLARLLLWLLPPVVAGSAWLAVQRAQDRAAVAAAANRLAGGDLEGARRELERLARSRWVGARARAGAALVQAVTGGAHRSDFPPELLRTFDLERLLDDALARREWKGAEQAARLAAASGDPAAVVHRAAALLEQGREAEARTALEMAPGWLRESGLGRDVEQALDLRARGAGTLVRDRRGTLLGVLDADARLELLDPDAAARVPGVVDLAAQATEAGVRLGIDLELSRLAEAALGAYRGTIVLLDPGTGEVLTAVSDPRTRREGGDPAFEQRREPASIAKIITTTAALRAGLDPDAEISRMICTGSQHYEGGTLWCSRAGGRLRGLDDAMAASCNTAFANLGLLVGRAGVVAEFRRYGFDDAFPWAGHVKQPEGDERQLADLAIGLEATDVTPLHAALLAAVVASGGSLPRPELLSATDGALGRSPRWRPVPAPRPILDPRWVPTLRQAMEAVVRPGGTAAGIAPAGFPVAMKTGTAAEWHHGYHVNYIGFGPLPEARVAFCVRVTHEPSSWRAARAGREVTAALLDGLQRPGLLRSPRTSMRPR